MAATLRPETMYGQTNCWALPKGQYGAFRGLDGEIWVMTHRAARNLAFQDRTPEAGKAECLLELQGSDLIGLPLKVIQVHHSTIPHLLTCVLSQSGSFMSLDAGLLSIT